MKTIIQYSAMALLILGINSIPGFSQNKSRGYGNLLSGWEIGIYGGYGFSNFSGEVPLTGEGKESYNNLAAWNGGIRATYLFHPNFGASVDLHYQQKGSEYQSVEEEWIRNVEIRKNYVQVPVSFLLQGNASGSVMPYGHAGLYGAYLVNARSSIKESALSYADSTLVNYQENVTNQFNKWDYGAVLGGGIKWSAGEKLLLWLELKYFHGLADIDTQSELYTRNSNFNFNIGIAWQE